MPYSLYVKKLFAQTKPSQGPLRGSSSTSLRHACFEPARAIDYSSRLCRMANSVNKHAFFSDKKHTSQPFRCDARNHFLYKRRDAQAKSTGIPYKQGS